MIHEVIKRIQYLLPHVEVVEQTVSKNNGVVLTGVMLKSKESNIAPVFYIDGMLEDGWSLDQIALYIANYYQQDSGTSMEDITSKMIEFDNVKNLLSLELVNQKLNEDLWVDIPYKSFLDLAAVVIVKLLSDDRERAVIKVTNKLLEFWDVTFEDIYEIAYSNFLKEEPVLVRMNDLLASLGCEDFGPLPMYVVTNETKVDGAVMMLHTNIFQNLANVFSTNLVVIPSSRHEVLVVPCGDVENLEIFNCMVKDVNQQHLEEVDILADHVYVYRKDSGWDDLT